MIIEIQFSIGQFEDPAVAAEPVAGAASVVSGRRVPGRRSAESAVCSPGVPPRTSCSAEQPTGLRILAHRDY